MKDKSKTTKLLKIIKTFFSLAFLLSACNEESHVKKNAFIEQGFAIENGDPGYIYDIAMRCKKIFKNEEPIVISVSFGHPYNELYIDGQESNKTTFSKIYFVLICNNDESEEYVLEELGDEYYSNDYSYKTKYGISTFTYTNDYIVNREWLKGDKGFFGFALKFEKYDKESLEPINNDYRNKTYSPTVCFVKNIDQIELMTSKEYSKYLNETNEE
ncbi:MAG: hypothetical protein K5925_01820 [Bacilli bacterium]|nr:hypothetical protein [Bacilli bacterium]